MASAPSPKFVSVDEYLSAEENADSKSEYIEGWVRAMVGATIRHNMLKRNCLVLLSRLLKGHPCQPFDSDTKLRIRREGRTRFYYPDLQVVCESNPQTFVFQDSPVLVVEILSPSTRQVDLDEKMHAYLQVPTLQYYLILEQHQPSAILMRRANEGFLRECFEGVNSVIELPFLGVSLALTEIYDQIEFTANCVQEPEVAYG